MAVLTDAFIATEPEVAGDLPDAGPAKRFRTVQARGIDSVKLATLAAILVGDELEGDQPDVHAFVVDIEHNFPLVRDLGATGNPGTISAGPWIFRIPDAMTARLAQLSRGEVARFGQRWAMTEEWQSAGVKSPAHVVAYLRKLCALARRAWRAQKSIYMWICSEPPTHRR